MTTLACVIGWPIEHSLSPAIHNAAFAATGLDWVFRAVAVRPGAIAEGMALLDELGAAGVSVTMPHKQAVLPSMSHLAPLARRVGAVNTIVRTPGGLVGHNTDGAGFLRAVQEHAPELDPADLAATVLGAGGAARAVAVALADAGARVTVVARRMEQAAEVASLGPGITPATEARGGADLLVNATPVRDALPFGVVPDGHLAIDLLYGSARSAFLRAAEEQGMRAADGMGMLVGQAAEAFTLWTGVEAPVEAMRLGAVEALAGAPPASGMSGPAT